MKKIDHENNKDHSQVIERQLRELSSLAEMNKKIHSTMNIDRLLQILVEQAVIGVDFERGLIYLVEDQFLRCVAFLDRVKREKGSTIKNLVGFKMDETAVEVLVVKTGTSVYIKDAGTDKRVSQKYLKVTDTKEYCVVPLIGRTGVLGVLTGDKVYSKKPIQPEDIRTLELFAGHISLAIENASLFQDKEQFATLLENKVSERTSELAQTNKRLTDKMNELSTLFEMSGILNKSLRVDEVLKLILTLVEGLGYSKSAVHLWDGAVVGEVFQTGFDNEYIDIGFPPFKKGLRDRISKSTESLFVSNLHDKIKSSTNLAKYLLKKDLHASVVVPLRSKASLIAFMMIYFPEGHTFEEEQRNFFSAFGHQAAIALENAFTFQEVLDQKNQMETLSKQLEQENICLREKMKADQDKKFVIGKSQAMDDIMDLVVKVAPTSTSVIIYGETGTGKELIANAVHEMSPRKLKPMIKVNCAAIPEELLESELFGHEKGAFTGAHDRRVGMFQLAEGGTIFLDEIGDISLKTQTKLLRALQEGEIQPLGSENPIKVDVRVIAATNKDLDKKIREETFRSDLFYRLNVFPMTMPPLRDRREDIPKLVDFFLDKYAHLKKGKIGIDKEVLKIFRKYTWPGNIRELENIIERLMIISKPGNISVGDLPRGLTEDIPVDSTIKPLSEALLDFKKETVKQALGITGGKKSEAASLLGMPKSNFSRLLKQLGMN
jgi:transcriptional regulator with GAF, ATPase, and Fis domain